MTLRYFGFYPGSVSPEGSIEEQGDSVNITKALSFQKNMHSGSWGDVDGLFARAAQFGQRVLMNAPEGDDRTLRFSEWAAQIKPHADQIYGFFVRDEPDAVSGGNPAILEQLLLEVEALCGQLRAEFPSCRCMMTLGAFHPFLTGFWMPNGITDVAIECYHGQTQWLDWLARLGPHLGGRSVWLMPLCYGPVSSGYPSTDEAIVYEAQVIYDYAKSDDRVVGIMPFAWYDGVRERPNVRSYFQQVGREIVRGTVPPTASHAFHVEGITPTDALAGRSFTLAIFGGGFAPGAVVQYAMTQHGPWFDYPVVRRDERTLVMPGIAVGAGTYWVRVKNAAGVWGSQLTSAPWRLQVV